MNLEEKWENLRRGYEPSSDDNPDNYDWYARYFATKQILLDAGLIWEEVGHICHQGVSFGCDDLKGFLLNAKRLLPEIPKRPERGYVYDCEPIERVEEDAYELFRSQFKARWSGKRINSKFAKEKWEQVKDKAIEIARQEHVEKQEQWKERERTRDDEWNARLREWDEKRDVAVRIREAFERIFGDIT